MRGSCGLQRVPLSSARQRSSRRGKTVWLSLFRGSSTCRFRPPSSRSSTAALRECPSRGKVVLDLRLVSYISSTGVGLLATSMVEASKRSVTFALDNITPRVRSIIDTLGLLSFFHVEESDE